MRKKLLMNNYSENGLMPDIYFNFCDYDKYIFLNDGIMQSQSIDIVSDCGNYRFVGVGTFSESRPASSVVTEEQIINGLKMNVLRLIDKSLEMSFKDMTEITIVIAYRYLDVSAYKLINTNLGDFKHSTSTRFVFGDRQKWTEPTVNILPANKLSIGAITSTPDLAEYYDDGVLIASTNNARKVGDMNKIKFDANTSDYTLFSISIFNRRLAEEKIIDVYKNEFNKFYNL